jgi:hypothetical protein
MLRKYRFKQQFKDAQIAIPGVKALITRHTLTDEVAEMIFKKFGKFSHNIELVPEGETHDSYGSDGSTNPPRRLRKYSTSVLKDETKPDTLPGKPGRKPRKKKGNE